MKRRTLIQWVLNIAEMNQEQLSEFQVKLGQSDISGEPREFILKAIDLRATELSQKVSPLIEASEYHQGEAKGFTC